MKKDRGRLADWDLGQAWPQAVPKGSKTLDRMTRLDAKQARAKLDFALLIALGRVLGLVSRWRIL